MGLISQTYFDVFKWFLMSVCWLLKSQNSVWKKISYAAVCPVWGAQDASLLRWALLFLKLKSIAVLHFQLRFKVDFWKEMEKDRKTIKITVNHHEKRIKKQDFQFSTSVDVEFWTSNKKSAKSTLKSREVRLYF